MSDDDELPPVSLVFGASTQSSFKMPSADEIALERAREQECQRELELLHNNLDDEDVTSTVDTSGIEETEASLAAAVCALQVRPSEAAVSAPPPDGAILLEAMRVALPDDAFLAAYLQALLRAPAEALAERTLSAIEAALCSSRQWADAEVLGCGTWLCAAVAWAAPRVRALAAARALHRLLEARTSVEQADALARCVCSARCSDDAVREWAWRARTCDALRAGGEVSRRVASVLRQRALLDLLEPHGEDAADVWSAAASAWRRADVRTRRALVLALGRELADGDPTVDEWAAVDAALGTLSRRVPAARRFDLQLLDVQMTACLLRSQFQANK